MVPLMDQAEQEKQTLEPEFWLLLLFHLQTKEAIFKASLSKLLRNKTKNQEEKTWSWVS